MISCCSGEEHKSITAYRRAARKNIACCSLLFFAETLCVNETIKRSANVIMLPKEIVSIVLRKKSCRDRDSFRFIMFYSADTIKSTSPKLNTTGMQYAGLSKEILLLSIAF